MKKKFFVPVFSLIVMMGITVLVYGKSYEERYRYANGYEMKYAQVYADSATAAYTYTDDPASVFVGIFIYKNSKEIVNSKAEWHDLYLKMTLPGSGDYSISYHSMKDSKGNLLGDRRSLDSRYFPSSN